MKTPDTRQGLASELSDIADAYQAASVIPHCAVCARPCCKLDALVLELEWKQIKTLWRIEDARAVFDRKLASGKGPVEIRAGNGLYYVHSKPCPAYDEAGHACTVYGQAIKPAGCSDFPVYEDEGSVMADLRCEAVDLSALVAEIARTVGPEYRVVESADRDFPFLVTLSLKRKSGASAPGKRARVRRA
jgi:Fe-S-cluster containining protein